MSETTVKFYQVGSFAAGNRLVDETAGQILEQLLHRRLRRTQLMPWMRSSLRTVSVGSPGSTHSRRCVDGPNASPGTDAPVGSRGGAPAGQ